MGVRSPVRSAVRTPGQASRGRGLPWSIGTPAAPVFVLHPANVSVTEGADAVFTSLASGLPRPGYQAELDSGSGFGDIPGATSRTYTFSAVTLADDGKQIRFVATNSQGTATSNAATLTVTALSTITADTTAVTADSTLVTADNG